MTIICPFVGHLFPMELILHGFFIYNNMNIFDIFEILDELLDEPVVNLSARRQPRTRYILTQRSPKKKKSYYKPPQYRRSVKKAQIDEDYSGLLDAFNMR